MAWNYYEVEPQIKLEKIYSFFHTQYPDGFRFEGEMHNFWECMYVHRGTVVVSSDERVVSLTGGALIVHKPMELHRFYVADPQGTAVTIFAFSAWGRGLERLQNKVFSLDARQEDQVQALLDLAGEQVRAGKVFAQARKYFRFLTPCQQDPIYGQQLANIMENLLLGLSHSGAVADHTVMQDAQIFRAGVDFMNDNMGRKITVIQVAQHCNVSVSSLKRVFDKYAGMGVHKYLLSMKIQAADALLRGGLPVGQVAEKLGFPSQSNFSAAFKRETGSSPSAIKNTK